MARARRLTRAQLVAARLANHRLAGAPFASVAEAVAWFGAVQAQDLRGALWGIGQRVRAATEADVERALADRAIVRTWPMRGTLHAVAAADVHWLVGLLAPRVLARAAGRHRELALDARTFATARALCERALAGGAGHTRDELYALLAAGGISCAGQRGIHILAALAMQGVLVIGAMRGKQPTFALLDEWIAPPAPRDREQLLGELARRYFTSHGPATLADFAWWTGLPLGEARRAHAIARPALTEVTVDDAPYWHGGLRRARAGGGARLLPPYDEYTVAYRDRAAILDPAHRAQAKNGIFSPVVLVGGRVVGTWTRELRRDRVIVHPRLFGGRAALGPALARYGEFVGKPAALR
jgi:winged helix DNA-binding protein